MLTGETTIGRYPIEVLSMMSKILESAEEDSNYFDFQNRAYRTEKQDTTGSIAFSVVWGGAVVQKTGPIVWSSGSLSLPSQVRI